jgi:hypothetical protein
MPRSSTLISTRMPLLTSAAVSTTLCLEVSMQTFT